MKWEHGGSVWKSLALLFRGLLQIAGFLGMWVGCIYWGTSWASVSFGGGLILLLYCMIFHIILPLWRLFR